MAVIDRIPGQTTAAAQRRVQPGTASAGGQTASREVMGKLPVPVLLYLAAVMLPIGFNLGPLYMTGLRAYLLIMIVPLTLRLFSGRLGRILWTDTLFFLHIAWTTVAIGVNSPSMVVQNTGSAAVEFLGGYLVARAYIRTRADFIALCRWLGLLICLTLPLALIEARTGTPLLINLIEKLPGIRSVGNVNIEPRMGLQRVQVFMTHPIHYGLFCSTAFALTVVALKDVLSTSRRFLIAGGIGLCVFLSLSSGALLPMILQIFMIVWIALFGRLRRPWLVLGVLIGIAWVVVDILSNRSPLMVFLSYATFSSHNAYWRAQIFDWGMKNVWGSPIFGIGFNDWVRPFYMYSGSMDNFWLVMAVRYGIPGFLLIAVGYGIGLLRVGFRDFTSDPVLAQLRRAWMFTFVGLTLTICTVHIWTTIYSFVFFMFGAGIWFITAEPAGSPSDAAPEGLPRGAARLPVAAAHGGPQGGVSRAEPPSQPAAARHEAPRHTRFPIKPRP